MIKVLMVSAENLNKEKIQKYYVNSKNKEVFAFIQLNVMNLVGINDKSITDTVREFIKENEHIFKQYDYVMCNHSTLLRLLSNGLIDKNSIGLKHFNEDLKAFIMYLPKIYDYTRNTRKFNVNITRTFFNIVDSDKKVQVLINPRYPKFTQHIKQDLDSLLVYPQLAVDIETTGIKLDKAKLVSIAFAYNTHNAVSFRINTEHESEIKDLLREFFKSYQGRFIFHKANFDIPILIYQLFMNEDITDILKQIEGINYFRNRTDDSMLMAYLSLNACDRESYSLKLLAEEYTGKYGVDTKNIESLSDKELLTYNATDTVATFYLYDKYKKVLKFENQEEQYSLLLDFSFDCMRMQLNGLPLDMNKVKALRVQLETLKNELLEEFKYFSSVEDAEIHLAHIKAKKRNSVLKTKRVTYEDELEPLNITSKPQLAVLLYKILNLPVLQTTKGGNPSVDKDTAS